MSKLVLLIISGIYSIIVGIGIIGLWIMLYRSNEILELKTELIAEITVGSLCLISGILLLLGISWSPYLYVTTMGLVIYSVINSAGYYGQKKQWLFVAMFGLILIVSVSLVILIIISL